MTGWRIGYACANPELLAAMGKVHQYSIMCAPTTAQAAALAALEQGGDHVIRMRQEYDRRRHLIVDGFNTLGLDCFEPRGAFYAFPSIARSGMSRGGRGCRYSRRGLWCQRQWICTGRLCPIL